MAEATYISKLAAIKREVGTQCTYLAFAEESGEYFFQANLTNSSGAKDRVKILIDGTPESLSDESYEQLLEILKTRSYVTS